METIIFIALFIVGFITGLFISFLRAMIRPIAHLTILKTITEDGLMGFQLTNLSFTKDPNKLSKTWYGPIRIHTKTQKLPPQ